MEIPYFIEIVGNIQKNLLDYLSNISEDCQDFLNYLAEQNISDNKYILKEVLHLIAKISDNHHRGDHFFEKIEEILKALTNDMVENFSNYSIFNIFKKNKRIILFLIENEIIKIDESIAFAMRTNRYCKMKYHAYFFNEIQSFIGPYPGELIEKEMNLNTEQDIEEFEQKRRNGVNDSYICQLIQTDSIEDFIVYVNRNNLPLSTTIEPSIFETNEFLLRNIPDLIEYAAFYGSIQIFKYLYLNNNSLLKPSLWLYSIHGNNPELIHYLEENELKPKDDSYEQCFIESIKCHHNDLANYIRDKYIDSETAHLLTNIYKYHNYAYFPSDIDISYWIYLCRYDYLFFVEVLLNKNIKKPEVMSI